MTYTESTSMIEIVFLTDSLFCPTMISSVVILKATRMEVKIVSPFLGIFGVRQLFHAKNKIELEVGRAEGLSFFRVSLKPGKGMPACSARKGAAWGNTIFWTRNTFLSRSEWQN